MPDLTPAKQKWNDPEWRSWARLYSPDQYREAELMASVRERDAEIERLRALIKHLGDIIVAREALERKEQPGA